jgi:signal transduction histidine kinase
VKASPSPDVVIITVDPNKMKRVFDHLIRGAVNAMPSRGVLSIETRDTPNAVEVDISDTGEPIPEKLRGGLFKPFGSRSWDGNGLSLPSCRKVVRTHGGELTFKAGEKGNTFTVYLPKACG